MITSFITRYCNPTDHESRVRNLPPEIMHTIGEREPSGERINRYPKRALGLSAVIRPEGILDYNRQYINDLPVASPHGSDFSALRELLQLHRFKRSTRHSNAT